MHGLSTAGVSEHFSIEGHEFHLCGGVLALRAHVMHYALLLDEIPL